MKNGKQNFENPMLFVVKLFCCSFFFFFYIDISLAIVWTYGLVL